MRFNTFFVKGVEVLQLGGQHWTSNAWPAEHWRENKGRWRIHMPAVDTYLSGALGDQVFGGGVEGIVLALEIADFASWPTSTFASREKAFSYKRKHRDLWCYGKIDWLEVQHLSLSLQYAAVGECILASINRVIDARGAPKDFDANGLHSALADALARGKPSRFTRTFHHVSKAA
jgi:hypothetical protein